MSEISQLQHPKNVTITMPQRIERSIEISERQKSNTNVDTEHNIYMKKNLLSTQYIDKELETSKNNLKRGSANNLSEASHRLGQRKTTVQPRKIYMSNDQQLVKALLEIPILNSSSESYTSSGISAKPPSPDSLIELDDENI
jgi:hypothetical protein